MNRDLPRILFFNINGSGLGHLSRCLAYARRLRGRAHSTFFSLASAIEIIQDMGFEADYFVSEFWTRSRIGAWNRELAIRFGLMLEEVQPDVVLFDGTWPFHGFMDACDSRRVPLLAWSNRGLHKPGFPTVPVDEGAFDLVIRPGEIGSAFEVERESRPGRKVVTPPVTLLSEEELLDRDQARASLGLEHDRRLVLFSLGPGNLKDIGDIARNLIREFGHHGFDIVWARAPITVSDVPLPERVRPVAVYPLVRFMRAFDVFAGAAGYNTCCEVIQAGIPSLLIPNMQVADDQTRRANLVAAHAPVVVSPCETQPETRDAVARLVALEAPARPPAGIDLSGAEQSADEIISLVNGRHRA
jgi:UDP:flavonoid glycosyltransferase YjiC (YdhE family)